MVKLGPVEPAGFEPDREISRRAERAGRTIFAYTRRICAVSLFILPLVLTLPVHAESGTGLSASQEELSTDAQRRLGRRLITGSGGEVNTTEGLKLLEAAIKKGDRQSLIVLGRLMMDGRYLKADLDRARSLFQDAARMGDFEGVELLGEHLMWNGRTPTDAREAERLLSMAGEAGRGSAWTILASGVVNKKLPTPALSNYDIYVEKARVLGDSRVEVLDGKQLLYRDPDKALANLEKAASMANADAIKYLIALFRDGKHSRVKRDMRRARAYFEKYGKSLPAEAQQQMAFLFQAATAQGAVQFEKLSRTARSRSDFSSIELQKEIYRANPNLSIYLAQESLRGKGLYNGSLSGLATATTVASIQKVCGTLRSKFDCGKEIMSDRVIARMVVY